MYKPENQSWIGSLIQKIWSENQGHLTLYIFQKKISSHVLSIFIPSHSLIPFHSTSISFSSSFSLHFHSIFIPFHFINKIPLSGLFSLSYFPLSYLCAVQGVLSQFPQLGTISAARTSFRSQKRFPQPTSLCFQNKINCQCQKHAMQVYMS